MSAASRLTPDEILERRSEADRRYRERNIEKIRAKNRTHYAQRRAESDADNARRWDRFKANAERVEAEWCDWFGLEEREIIERFVAIHGVDDAFLLGPVRRPVIATCRMQLASVLRRLYPKRSLEWLGAVLGGRDYTTALHSVRVWPAKAAKLGIPVDLEAA